MDTWLSLNEYSNKYRVSLSTLRRRIKSDKVEFAFRYGKYFLKDVSLQGRASISFPHTPKPPVLKPKNREALIKKASSSDTKKNVFSKTDLSAYSFFNIDKDIALETEDTDQVLTSHNQAESEEGLQLPTVQNDYKMIIQKQKDQITKLHGEIDDLKTLIMALE
ncbi:MAG: hypothetical protein HAW60_00225 [Bdellovibrionales bacterium]|nr:hypothetical protein [Bdellovibrionales bacterium]